MLVITLFVPDIKSEISERHTSVMTTELRIIAILTASVNIVARKNAPHSVTKSFMYLLRNTATIVPKIATRGKQSVSSILK